MPARVVPLAAVPMCLIVARIVPSPGVRSSARRLREARRADRLWKCRCRARRAGRRRLKEADQSPMSVSALDIRSPGERRRVSAPSRSTSERRINRTIGLPPYVVGPVSWRPCAGGHHARRLLGDGPAGQRTRPDRAVRRSPAAGRRRQGSLLAAMWSSAALSEMQAATEGGRWRRQPTHRGVQLSSDPRSPPCARVAQLAGFGGAGETETAENRGGGTLTGVQPAALAAAGPPSCLPEPVGKPDG